MISVRRLRVYGGASAVAVTALLALTATAALSLPLYLGQAGSFMVSADSISGNGFDLGLAIDPNSGADGGALPAGEVNLQSATIDALRLEKTFDLSAVLGGNAGVWKLRITTQPGTQTTASGLRLNATVICADTITFGPGFAIDGKGANTETVDDDLSIGASTVTLGRPGIEATYLATESISLSGIRIEVLNEDYELPPCGARS